MYLCFTTPLLPFSGHSKNARNLLRQSQFLPMPRFLFRTYTPYTAPASGLRRLFIVNKAERDEDKGLGPIHIHITRREAIQLLNAGLGVATVILLTKMKEQYRFMSPKTILSAFGISNLPMRSGASSALAATSYSDRLRNAVNFIGQLESHEAIPCPDFPSGADWINSRPLSLGRELSGKLVLLDFFTYCCINCQHVLPKLRSLEMKYGEDGSGGVVVVGVHSAKFSAERETANVAAAVDRYDVRHPVVNDESMKLWNTIGISSWPTLALINPAGKLLAVWSGEQQEDDIDLILSAALEYYEDSIDHRPLPKAPKRAAFYGQLAQSPLRYPGKIALSADGASLYVSDSGNNRVLQVNLQSGLVARIFGSGEPGFVDARDESKARFHSPQGIVEHNNSLYVADTESHAVRAIDLKSGAVTTIGGTGEQGFDYRGGKKGTAQPLSSPWDVEVVADYLYVAMAGTHQIWRLRLPSLSVNKESFTDSWQVFSGTGRELEKNSSVGRTAGWAQPSHLSASPSGVMFVADSESSSLRAIDLQKPNNPTHTIAGGDGLLAENLFAFGDKEGRGANARFQHCLAVCADEATSRIFVADSYNHRIKIVDDSGLAKDFCGSGKPGFKDGSAKEAMFWEPSGLALTPDGSKLFVADTNNFAVRVVDTQSGKTSTLQLSSVPSAASTTVKPLIPNRRRAVEITCESVSPDGVLSISIALPKDSHFTPGTTSRFQVNIKGDNSTGVDILASGVIQNSTQSGTFKVDFSKNKSDASDVEVEAVTYYCTEVDDVCRVESDIFTVPLAKEGQKAISVLHTIKPRRAPMRTRKA